MSVCVSFRVLLRNHTMDLHQICTNHSLCVKECTEIFWYPYLKNWGHQRSKRAEFHNGLMIQLASNLSVRNYLVCYKMQKVYVFSISFINICRTEIYSLSLERLSNLPFRKRNFLILYFVTNCPHWNNRILRKCMMVLIILTDLH